MKKILLFLIALTTISIAQKAKHTFELSNDNFLLDGKPFQIISGEMHFARVPRECWRDRFRMIKAMGINTVATYVFWNYHEPEKGKYNFKGNADVAEFCRVAQQEGLWVLIRPSAYACAEWEFGGYPYWLIKEKDLKVRSRDPKFISMMKNYYNELGKQLSSLQVTKGGPILMVQVENEYGFYGNDKEYMEINKKMMRDAGFNVPLYTCDPPNVLANGCIDGALPASNGSDNVKEVFNVIKNNNNGKGPFFIAEWYPAWFDWWGTSHHTVPAEKYTPRLDTVMANGISINMYMVHGGTTRDFMNGANYDDKNPYAPQISSYDYDAPIDEAGNATPKFYAFRDVIKKHLPQEVTLPEVPAKKKTISIANIKLERTTDITTILPKQVKSKSPLSFEDLNQAYGYVLYRATITGPAKGNLNIQHLRDYGIVFVNGKRVAVLDRRLKQESCEIELTQKENTLEIFVENLGRINFGKYLNDNRKGITEKVLFNDKEISHWKIFGFPFNGQPNVSGKGKFNSEYPSIKRGSFVLKEVGDTYLDMRTFGKGHVWLNGHNLGRYWNVGPQQTLYIPAQWLKKGKNEIVVFEQIKTLQNEISSLDKPILNELQKEK